MDRLIEIDIVNKCAKSKGWAIDDTHYYVKDGAYSGSNVYRYIQPYPKQPNGMPVPTGLPTYIIVKNGVAAFLDADEIMSYWRSLTTQR